MGAPPSGATRHPWSGSFTWERRGGAARRLTVAERDHFDERGWIVVEDLVDAGLLAELTAELDAIEAAFDESLGDHPDERFLISERGAISFSAYLVARCDIARRVSRLPAILDICHDLIGPDVRLYHDQLVYKKPDKPREFPWHQDNGYAFLEPQQYLTVWLALTDATPDNGCPVVAPGAHRGGTYTHEYVHPLGLTCFDSFPGAVAAPVRAGGAVVFSSLTPHMTTPNTTGAVRKTYILQYASDGAEVLDGDPRAGAPVRRRRQDDPQRQYPVLCGGRPATGPPAS